ncbi:MAG: UDP-N-acetylglucosamine 2-epimerase (non-hydrolyzing) [Clostridiales bacterium]|nr:UDP-N-acetylglucosamine 2-epimerase (non-hydrolyzing) [Clostridiales bacterium]
MNKIKVLSVFGTRPEAIKMAPLVKKLIENEVDFDSKVLVTAQHREMLDQVLDIFEIVPDYDLNIMKHGQTLGDITSEVIKGLDGILKEFSPDIVLVHGDTTTSFAAALAAFYNQVTVGHVEAGLRSGNKYSPYPEEMNRSLTGRIADFHFAPTKGNEENLIIENIDRENIYITGNTVIDALKSVVDEKFKFSQAVLAKLDFENRRVLLLTAHRRENIGEPMENIFKAILKIVQEFDDVELIYPVHMNPVVQNTAQRILGSEERIHLIEPLEYVPFANLISKSFLVLTDSGGIQEEAPALGKPVLVLREETERPEAVDAGTVKIVGTNENNVYDAIKLLLTNKKEYEEMANAVNPYGDGETAQRIIDIIKKKSNFNR